MLTRESRKSVSRKRDDDRLFYYDNQGRSSTRSATLEITNHTPLVLGLTETRFTMGLGYRDAESNHYNVNTTGINDDSYDAILDADLIYYKDELILPEELPAWDYNVPLSVRLHSVTEIPKWGLTWSNFYRLRRGGTIARDTREDYESPETGLRHDIFEDHEFGGLFTINSRIQWQRALTDGSEVYAPLRNSQSPRPGGGYAGQTESHRAKVYTGPPILDGSGDALLLARTPTFT